MTRRHLLLAATAIVALFAIASAVAARTAPRCIPFDRSWLRTDTTGWVILEMEGDSAIGAHWRRPSDWPATIMPTRKTGPVYGQWGRVVAGAPIGGGRALVVTWGLGASCAAEPTGRAIAHRTGSRVFIGTKPKRNIRFIRGGPVWHLGAFTDFYAPAWVEGSVERNWLSVEEYVVWRSGLPTWDAWRADPTRMADSVRRCPPTSAMRSASPSAAT